MTDSNVRQKQLDPELMDVNPWNPNAMDQDHYNRLVKEIENVGFIEAVQVIPKTDGRYTIIGGEHRVAVAKELKFETIPAIILEGPQWQDIDLQKLVTVRLNVLKGQINPERMALLYREMAEKYGEDALEDLFAFCLKAGTVVETVDGPKPIDKVFPGSEVYGGDGLLHKVVKRVAEHIHCDLLSFELERLPLPLECTLGHHMFVCKRDWSASRVQRRRVWLPPVEMQACDVEAGDAFQIPGYVLRDCIPELRISEHAMSLMEIPIGGKRAQGEGCKAGQGSCGLKVESFGLCKGHAQKWRAWRQSERAADLEDVIDEPAFLYNGRAKRIPETFEVTPDLAWLLGMYAANGSYDERSGTVCIGLNAQAMSKAQRVERTFYEVFGIEFQSKTPNSCENALNVLGHSKVLGRALQGWCGADVANKHFPYELMTAPESIVVSMLAGYWQGDGTFQQDRYAISTVSDKLAYQCVRLVVTLGHSFSLSRVPETADRDGYKRLPRWQLSWVLAPRRDCFEVEGCLVAEVKSITPLKYEGFIYDLELEEHHSYLANWVRVGNTDQHGWKKLVSHIKQGLSKAGIPKEKRKEFDEKAKEAKTLQDLERILNELWSSYGDTVQQSFMIFTYGKREHIYIAMDRKTRKAIKQITAHCKGDAKDINEVIGPAIQALADVLSKNKPAQKVKPSKGDVVF